MSWSFNVTSGIPQIIQTGTDNGLGGIATVIASYPSVLRNTAYTTAMMIKPPIPNGFWYKCTTAGTTAGTAPTYGTTLGGTTTDGTAVFTAFRAPDVITLGTANHYYMPDFRFSIQGSITNPNPQQQNFTCWDIIPYGASANFTSGAWATDGITPLWDGLHFCCTRVGANNADPVASLSMQVNSQMTLIGGEIQIAAPMGVDATSTLKAYYTRFRNSKEWGASSSRIRSYSATSIYRQCEFYDVAFDRFSSPTEFTVKARGSEYLVQYVGSANGGVNAKFTASGVENVDGTYDIDNYGCGWVELYNCAKGANLNVTTQNPGSAQKGAFGVPLFQDIKITAKDTAGNLLQNVRFNCTDNPTNSPTAIITTYDGLKAWNFINPLPYQATTAASGIGSLSLVIQFWWWKATTNTFQKNLRFPLSTAVLEGRAFNYKTMTASIVLGSNSVQDLSAGMIALDTPTTVTETIAGAITGINLVAIGTDGGTITVSSAHTLADIWHKYRYFISQFSNLSSLDTWTCIGGILDTKKWNIVIETGVNITGTSAINSLKTDGTITNNGIILTPYQDNTGVATVLTITGFAPNSAVYVEDNMATQKYYNSDVTGSVVLYLPPTATGSWYYAVEKYGNQRQSDFFTFSGGYKTITTKELPDNKLLLTKTQAQALALAKNPDEAYDLIAVLREQIPYISFGQIVTKDGATLNTGDYAVKLNQNATKVVEVNYNTKLITLKSAIMETGSVCNLIKINPPAVISNTTTEIITVNVEDANGDSITEINGVSGNLVDVWKCANGTVNADYATGTKIASNIGAVKFRFIHQDGFKLIFFDKNTLMARDCSMSKGTYSLGWYNYDSPMGGLDKNQANKLEHIFNTVDVVDNNVNDLDLKLTLVDTKVTAIPDEVWNHISRTLTSQGASGATIAEIQALNLAQEATSQAVKNKVDTLSNYNDAALVAKIDAIKIVTDLIKTTVEDKTGYALTTSQIELIATTVESHLLDEGDSQKLIEAIVGAIGNANIDETVLVAAIRADLERVGGKLEVIEVSTNNIEMDVPSIIVQLNGKPTLEQMEATTVLAKENTSQAIKTKVDTLDAGTSDLVTKVDEIMPKLNKMDEGLGLISNFEPYDAE